MRQPCLSSSFLTSHLVQTLLVGPSTFLIDPVNTALWADTAGYYSWHLSCQTLSVYCLFQGSQQPIIKVLFPFYHEEVKAQSD